MKTLLHWLENDLVHEVQRLTSHWAEARWENTVGILDCVSVLVHDGLKAGRASPGTVEVELRLDIRQLDQNLASNTQYVFVGQIPIEMLNHAAPTTKVTQLFLADLNRSYSKALEKRLKQIGKKFAAFELMPHDLLVRQSPMTTFLKHFNAGVSHAGAGARRSRRPR